MTSSHTQWEKDSKYASPIQNATHASLIWKPCYLEYITDADIYQQGKVGALKQIRLFELILQAGLGHDNSKAETTAN